MITNQISTTGRPHRLGRRQLEMIADQLDHIDHRLLSLLRMHRYATTRQLSDPQSACYCLRQRTLSPAADHPPPEPPPPPGTGGSP